MRRSCSRRTRPRSRCASTATCRASRMRFFAAVSRFIALAYIAGNFFFRIYRTSWKYAGIVDALNLALSIGVVSIFLFAINVFLNPRHIPLTVNVVAPALMLIAMGGDQVLAAAVGLAQPVRRLRRRRQERADRRRRAHGPAAGARVPAEPALAVPPGRLRRRRPAAARRAHPRRHRARRPLRHPGDLREEARRPRRARDPVGAAAP